MPVASVHALHADIIETLLCGVSRTVLSPVCCYTHAACMMIIEYYAGGTSRHMGCVWGGICVPIGVSCAERISWK